MLGYIRIFEDQLTLADLRTYQKLYCGLCHHIARYSQVARLTLSFDMVFFLILSACEQPSLAESCVRRKCFGKLKTVEPLLDYWACVSVLMIYYKLSNDRQDGEWVSALKLRQMLLASHKAEDVWPEAGIAIKKALDEIDRAEKAGCPDPDTVTKIFGRLMEGLMERAPTVSNQIEEMQVKKSISRSISEWLYYLDIFDDRKTDERKRQYNPLLIQRDKLSDEEYRDYLVRYKEKIDQRVNELQRLCAFLPYEGYSTLVKNVLHSGVTAVTAEVYARGEKNENPPNTEPER